MLAASVFLSGWGILHFLIPSLGKFGQQLQGVPDFTVDYFFFLNFMGSLCLVVFGLLGVVVASRFWDNVAAVKLIAWPLGLLCLAYAGYMLVSPWRNLPFPVPITVYQVGPALLALCFVIPAVKRKA
jgi:hypothetical protein